MERTVNSYRRSPAVFSLILCCVLVLSSVAVYLCVGLLPRSVSTADISHNKLYTLHAETVKFLETLDTDIDIILISETGIPEYGIPESILRRYAEKNRHIKISVVSPEDVYEEYGTLTEGCAIIRSEARETVVYSSDYFDVSDEYFIMSYNAYDYLASQLSQQYGINSYADFMYSGFAESLGLFDIARYQSALTNAIRYAVTADITTIYAVSEHDEVMLDVYLYPELRMNNTELIFGKLSDGIPANADGVLINDPKKDITESDVAIIREFLDGGGKLTVTTAYENIKELTNLRAILEEYGLTTDGGFLCEDDTNFNYSNYAMVTLPTVNKDAFGGYLTADGLKPIVTGGTGITVTEKAGFTVSSLLSTSPNAYTKQDAENEDVKPEFNAETDVRGQYSVAAISKNGSNGSSVLWIPNVALGDSDFDTASERNNFPVFTAALNCQYGADKPIDIPGVTITVQPLETPDAVFPIGMVAAIIIPCIIIAVGGVVVIKRRK